MGDTWIVDLEKKKEKVRQTIEDEPREGSKGIVED